QISGTHNKHSFRVGFEAERVQIGTASGTASVGQPTFQSFSDFLIGRQGGCGAAAAPSVLSPGGCNGGPTSNMTNQGGTTTANSLVQVNPRVLLLSSFVQDDIKLTPRLTI